MPPDGYDRRHAALHAGTRLEWFTVGWNVIEVVVTVSLGVAAGSLALVAFGLDSVIEVFASLVVSVRKLRLAQISGSAPLRAEAGLTFLDGCLATGILVALVLNAAAGLWWADQVAALGVGVICLIEAVRNVRQAAQLSMTLDDIV